MGYGSGSGPRTQAEEASASASSGGVGIGNTSSKCSPPVDCIPATASLSLPPSVCSSSSTSLSTLPSPPPSQQLQMPASDLAADDVVSAAAATVVADDDADDGEENWISLETTRTGRQQQQPQQELEQDENSEHDENSEKGREGGPASPAGPEQLNLPLPQQLLRHHAHFGNDGQKRLRSPLVRREVGLQQPCRDDGNDEAESDGGSGSGSGRGGIYDCGGHGHGDFFCPDGSRHSLAPSSPERDVFFSRSMGDVIDNDDDDQNEGDGEAVNSRHSLAPSSPERDSFFSRSMREEDDEEEEHVDVDGAGAGAASIIYGADDGDSSETAQIPGPAVFAGVRCPQTDKLDERDSESGEEYEPETQRVENAAAVVNPPSPLDLPEFPTTPKKSNSPASIARRAISEGQIGTPRTPRRSPSFLFSSPEKIRPLGRVASAASLSLRNITVQTATPVRKAWQANKRRASEIIKRRRAKRAARLARIAAQPPPRSPFIVIPADHPVKIVWDVLTVILTIISAYSTHQNIRDRTYEQSPSVVFIEFWFIMDILLNFVTEHKTSDGQIIRDGKAVWARYLTSWFVIDAISVVPWERIYVRPIVEAQKRRNIFTKTFFRSKAVVRVTRVLRGRHLKLFGRVAKQTQQVGVGGQRLLRLIIKYVPKYLLFFRNMRGVLVVRLLRFVHFLRKLWKQLVVSVRTEPLQVLRRPDKVFRAASADMRHYDLNEDDLDDEDLDDDENSLLDDGGADRNDENEDFADYLHDDEYIGDDDDDDASVDAYMDRDGADEKDCQVVLLPQLDDASNDNNHGAGGGHNDLRGSIGGASASSREPVLRFRATAKSKGGISAAGESEFFSSLS